MIPPASEPSEPGMKRGRVHVITGDGKGKTSACMGMALRALGRGYSVFMMQFMKDGDSGEVGVLERLTDTIRVHPFPDSNPSKAPQELILTSCGLPGFLEKGSPDPESVRKAREGLEEVRTALDDSRASGRKWMFILDECNLAMDFALLEMNGVMSLLDALPDNVEIVLTGRNASREIVKRADYVSEILLIKHPYDKGVMAREGIEF